LAALASGAAWPARGAHAALTALAAWLVPGIRTVERDVPDAPHAPPSASAAPQPAARELEVAATG
jgi:hypothetical protein